MQSALHFITELQSDLFVSYTPSISKNQFPKLAIPPHLMMFVATAKIVLMTAILQRVRPTMFVFGTTPFKSYPPILHHKYPANFLGMPRTSVRCISETSKNRCLLYCHRFPDELSPPLPAHCLDFAFCLRAIGLGNRWA